MSMALSNWLCANNTKNMLLKIIHPGGRVELHDRPILAAEIMLQYPRCCVTHPNVFRQPWAVVTPDTVLLLGQKFYVVPISTLRKLQRGHRQRSSSAPRKVHASQTPGYQQMKHDNDEVDGVFARLFTSKNTPKLFHGCLKKSDDGMNGSRTTEEMQKEGNLTEDSCLMCLIPGKKIKEGEDPPETINSPQQPLKNNTTPPPLDHWQPNLASINEEE